MPANTFIIQLQPVNNWSAFVNHWEKAYAYLDDNQDYDTYLVNRDVSFAFDKANLFRLFAWKNKTGDKLNAKKEKTVDGLIGKLVELNQLRERWDDSLFNKHFGEISAIWQTFLMHIIQPDRFPIFDQHVYRAFTYLQTSQAEELKGTTKLKLTYYDQYRLFFDSIRNQSGCDARKLDRALWAFGKFIKQYPGLFVEV